jgi:NADH-quinone oxidoreductase subunit J
MESLFFLLLAATSVFAALMVILQKNPLSAVLFLVLVFFCLAALFVLLAAPFIAAIQLIIYAGAIMVLFLFVLMLLNVKHGEEGGFSLLKAAGIVVPGLLLVVTAALLRSVAVSADSGFARSAPSGLGSVENVGRNLFTLYLLPFEIAGFLLLAGIIGAIALAKKKL